MDIDRWIATWSGPLVALLAAWGAPWGEAHELAQDALVEAYHGRARLRGDPADPTVAGPWLRGIARHLFLARSRRRATRREEPLGAAALHSAAPGTAQASDPRSERALAALTRLPEDLRESLYLHYLEETPVREVAALLGVPESTVQGRLFRARRALRTALGADEGTRIGPSGASSQERP
jgi:RNA polymerase sigma-70 factor (ECF subfamily)